MDVSFCAVEVRKEAWNLAIQFGCLYFETSAKKNIGIVSLVPEAVAQSFLKAHRSLLMRQLWRFFSVIDEVDQLMDNLVELCGMS